MFKIEANYDFINCEKEILRYWEAEHCFEKLLEKNAQGPKYRFIDGPITANNPMGIHHAWGRTLKDTFLRYKAMNGYTSHYRNGFDGQGLWVEVEVEKELGFKTKRDIEAYGLDRFTKACVERVRKYSQIITEQSKRLGQWMRWDNSYYTHTDENITGIWAVLKKCHERGWLKQIYRPMPWCGRCGTSLSEHEMSGSYQEVEHEAVFVRLPLRSGDANILVWTTTPWTLSSNTALAVHPDLEYVKAEMKGEKKPLILSKEVYLRRFSKDGVRVLETFKGRDLAGIEYETMFPDLPRQKGLHHRIVLWDEVSSDEGSGVVHIAPGCGAEDFELGLKENLDIIMPIDENANFFSDFGFLAGKNAGEVNDLVFTNLQTQGKLFHVHKIMHSYPICWRCKKQVVFRLEKAWALDVEELREPLLRNARMVKWYPEYQGKRMEDWLNNMSDWNISRKRFYGLPLPFYKCSCGHLTVIGSREELEAKAVNPELVRKLPELHRPWIDEIKINCPKCGKEVSRIPEVGDVWLDAGIVPFSTLKYFSDRSYWQDYFPAEFVIEMKEQIRLWFYSLLFMST
ncbi:MAG: class I tRNA ligase family protein, partial [Acholeplasmataceae bacterium]|nr:class I tRNA ligase family protein [Acholeplasmataceae bacterium]